jgi:hypothetical protein
VTDLATKLVGSSEKSKSSTRMIWCAVLEERQSGGYSVHCDDGWFIVMEAKCYWPLLG